MENSKIKVACISLLFIVASGYCQKLVLTNDDGWAVAQIRAEYEALTEAGYDVRGCMLRSHVQHANLALHPPSLFVNKPKGHPVKSRSELVWQRLTLRPRPAHRAPLRV